MMERAENGAFFTHYKRYRYRLTRRIGEGERAVMFLMLNPSKADEVSDDATTRKCKRFAERWGFDVMHSVNLSPLVATNPAEITAKLPEPFAVQLRNQNAVLDTAAKSDLIVIAYGDRATRFHNIRIRGCRPLEFVELLWMAGHRLYCLGATVKGHPRHPGRVPYDTQLEEYTREHLAVPYPTWPNI